MSFGSLADWAAFIAAVAAAIAAWKSSAIASASHDFIQRSELRASKREAQELARDASRLAADALELNEKRKKQRQAIARLNGVSGSGKQELHDRESDERAARLQNIKDQADKDAAADRRSQSADDLADELPRIKDRREDARKLLKALQDELAAGQRALESARPLRNGEAS